MNILFIDGHGEDRDYYVERLQSASSHYAIYEATTGHDGLDMCRSHCIDCVILELELPDMSGFGVLVKLVPFAHAPEIPVIVLTRLNFISLMELALLNGAYLCLHKGIVPGDALETTILQAISAVRQDLKRSNSAWNLDRAA